ncbi:MAG TPA: transglutaminase-like cysteine peptidase [Candidatus Sulfotelmatobacter sp.]|nr:transglutaminase-like cysteine peptidase [Candidatus Sulfotelmatobacter sp.]
MIEVRRPLGLIGRVILTAGALLLTAASFAEAAPATIFGAVEIRHDGIKPFPKWIGALAKYEQEKIRYATQCLVTRFSPCHWKEWHDLLDRLRGQPRATQLDAVNRYMNRQPYVLDMVNWGVPDYWESPGEFFLRNGNCHDYAIAKYLSLRLLGWNKEDLRIVALNDLNLRVGHAVLVVIEGDHAVVLDNQVSQVVEATSIHHYQPIYAVNEDAWWLYRH